MGKKYTLEYENSPLGGILSRQLFLATDDWKNKLATIKDVEIIIAGSSDPGPASIASDVIVNTASFTGTLSHLDTNVQHALQTLDNHSHTNVTTSKSGFMSATDKTKLDASTANNTASTIVTRDSNKDFSANTITTNSIKIGNGEVEMVYDSESDSVKFIWN